MNLNSQDHPANVIVNYKAPTAQSRGITLEVFLREYLINFVSLGCHFQKYLACLDFLAEGSIRVEA